MDFVGFPIHSWAWPPEATSINFSEEFRIFCEDRESLFTLPGRRKVGPKRH